MSENVVQVKLEASYGQFQTAFNNAQKAAGEAITGIRNELRLMSNQAKFDTKEYESTIEQFGNIVKDRFKGINGAINGLQTAWAQLGVVIGAGMAVGAAVNEAAEYNTEIMKLSRTLNITTAQASALSLAIGDVFGTTSEYTNAVKGLETRLRTNEKALNAMGLATRDSSGELRDQQTLMMDALEVLRGYKEGTDRSLASQAMFGKGLQASSELLALNSKGIADAAEKAKALNLVVGAESVAATNQYRTAMSDLGDSLTGIKVTIGNALMPVFSKMVSLFADVGPTAVKGFTLALSAATAAMIYFAASSIVPALVAATAAAYAFTVANGAVAASLVVVRTALTLLTGPLGIIIALTGAIYLLATAQTDAEKSAEAHKKALDTLAGIAARSKEEGLAYADILITQAKAHLKAAEAALIQTRAMSELNAAGDRAMTHVKNTAKGDIQGQIDAIQRYKKELDSARNAKNNLIIDPATAESGGKDYVDPKAGDKAAAEAERARKAALAAAAKAAAEEQKIKDDAFKDTMDILKQELDGWKYNYDERLRIAKDMQDEALRNYGATSDQYREASQKIVAIEIARNAQIAALDQEAADAKRNRLLEQIEAERLAADNAVQIGALSVEQRLVMEQGFEESIFAIKQQALLDSIALMELDPDKNPVLLAQIKEELLQIEFDHLEKIKELRNQAAIEAAAPMDTVFRSMETSFAGAIAGIITRTMTLRQALSSIWKSIFATFVQEMIAKPLAQWAIRVVRELVMHKMLEASKKVINKASATAEVAKAAGVAGANGVASFAAAPWPVNMGAPGFGAAMALAAGAFGAAATASASEGYDIPAGVNPVTQLHQREMVLPAAQADVVRDMADGGGSAGGGITIHVHAADGESVKRMLMNNKPALVAAIQQAKRDGMKIS